MTDMERQETLKFRKESSVPLHAPPHPYNESGNYLITAANFEHAPIMSTLQRLSDFESRLIETLFNANAQANAWVVLPNHYHVLVQVETLAVVPKAIGQLHGITSREWNLIDQQTGKRRVWYNYSDRFIRDESYHYRALNYIHINPVKHNYCTNPYDWP